MSLDTVISANLRFVRAGGRASNRVGVVWFVRSLCSHSWISVFGNHLTGEISGIKGHDNLSRLASPGVFGDQLVSEREQFVGR